MIKIDRPKLEDAPSWYPYFFGLAAGDDLISALQKNKEDIIELIESIPVEREEFNYAEDKWTTRQVFIHLADDERYYAYKAFCFSRQVDVFLEVPQGKDYNKDFNATGRTLTDIAEELISVRNATITLFSHMTNEMLDFKFPNQKEQYSARSLGWMTVGHAVHHCNLIREKYLI
ncbi:MAG: DinB family protein [Dyadobacter sp.]